MKLDRATCDAIMARFNKWPPGAVHSTQSIVETVCELAEQQQPEPAVRPTAGALRAAKTWQAAMTPFNLAHTGIPPSKSEMASIIDREAGLPQLVAALWEMKNTHGRHGPCEGNGCRSCNRAYDEATTALATTDPEQKGADTR